MYYRSLVRKYCYKHLTMVVASSPEIFQQNMDDLFHGLEFIRVYINKILALIK